MGTYCIGRAQPFSYPPTWQLRSSAVQPTPRRWWRSACSTCRRLGAPAAAAGRQGSEAGGGGSTSSSSESYSKGIDGRSGSGSGGGKGTSGRSSSQAKLESILAGAGLDPAELQRHHPLAYTLLTVPLARVLAEVHADRLARAAAEERSLRLDPAQLMARICFLAYDVGLTADHIRARYRQYTRSLYFDLDGAQQLLAWLRSQQVTNNQLQIATLSNHQLWSFDVGSAQRCKQHVQECLGLTDTQWAEALTSQRGGLAGRPEVVDGVIAWLEAEPLGFSRAEVAQLWRSNPQLFGTPAATLHNNLQRLLSRCPLSKQQLRSFMRGNSNLLWLDCAGLLAKLDSLVAELPGLEARLDRLLVLGGSVLSLETEALLGKTSSLLQYGFSKNELSKMILKTPMILVCSLDSKLQPMLATLEGKLGSRQAVVAAASKAPDLLVTALDTIRDNFRALQQLGLSEIEVQQLAARQPKLLAFRMGSAEFQGTLRYSDTVLGRTARQMLLQYPSYLTSSLRRIDYKVSFMEHKGDTHYKATLTFIKDADEKFCQRYGYSLAEFEAWEAQWLRSERAREYGLDKAREPSIGKLQAARQKGSKARVAARRKQRLAGADSKESAA
ncbi:hypothetical protein N2152v2_009743 [Parachlorella kessleri]